MAMVRFFRDEPSSVDRSGLTGDPDIPDPPRKDQVRGIRARLKAAGPVIVHDVLTVVVLLFRQLDRIEAGVRRFRGVWRFMNRGADRRQAAMIADAAKALEGVEPPLAVIVGYGPVGRAADSILRDRGMPTVVVDRNMDTVQELRRAGAPFSCRAEFSQR